MGFKICLSKKVLIFYAVITPLIMYGSLYNVINGIILQNTPSYRIGPFSIFGFLIMPFLLIVTYLKNICEIKSDQIVIHKNSYKFSEYDVYIGKKELPFKDRPLTSLFKKSYDEVVIKKIDTNEIVLVKDLDVFKKDIEHIRAAISSNKL